MAGVHSGPRMSLSAASEGQTTRLSSTQVRKIKAHIKNAQPMVWCGTRDVRSSFRGVGSNKELGFIIIFIFFANHIFIVKI